MQRRWGSLAPLEGMKAYVRSLSLTAMYRSRAVELGAIRGSGLIIEGERVVGPRLESIAMPSGGSTIDAEARACVAAILAALEEHG